MQSASMAMGYVSLFPTHAPDQTLVLTNHSLIPEKEESEAQSSSWFSGWFSRAKPVEEKKEEPEVSLADGSAASVLENLSAAWTPEEKARFYSAIGYDEEKGTQEKGFLSPYVIYACTIHQETV